VSELRKIGTLLAVLVLVLCVRVNAVHTVDQHDDAASCAKFGCNVEYAFSLSLKLPWNRW
jgi:hypothetical protein